MTKQEQQALAPQGTLRVALNFGNSVLVGRDASGAPAGITPDLAKELASRLGVPVRFVEYDEAGEVFADVDNDVWDVCFLADEPVRARKLAFSEPYIQIEGMYLVPSASRAMGSEDVDRKGVRIGVTKGSAYDLFLSRTLVNATLERGANFAEVLDLMRTGSIDVIAGVRPQVESAARAIAGSRLLPQPFMLIKQAMAVQQSRPEAARALHAYMTDAKRTGLVARLFERNRVQGGSLAP
jgi:polar amino acid transport system substrate-binding protein